MNRAIVLIAATLFALPTYGRVWYAATNGTENPNGTYSQPFSWIYAMGGADSRIRPGDTLQFIGGLYDGNLTNFGYGEQGYFCDLVGSSSDRIVVMPVPGHHVHFRVNASPAPAVMTIYGHHVTFIGFEVSSGAPPSAVMDGIRVAGPDHGISDGGHSVKIVNCVIHDATNSGIADQDAEGTELYGNVVYYSGRRTSGGNAYAVYGQNHFSERKVYEQNVFLHTFAGYTMHMYGTSETVNYVTLTNNVSTSTVSNPNVMFNSNLTDPVGIELYENFIYGRSNGEVVLQERKGLGSPVYNGNYIRGLISFRESTTGRVFDDNYIVGDNPIVTSNVNPTVPFNIATEPDNVWNIGSSPSLDRVFVYKNKYKPGRALVVVYNASNSSHVSVSLSGIVLGNFDVYDTQNMGGAPVYSGNFDGTPFLLPVNQSYVPPPVSQHPEFPAPTHTQRFGAYIVEGEADPLPIVLTRFAGYVRNGIVNLFWQTLSEEGSYGFYVQRRVADGDWTELGFVPAAGHSTSQRDYGYMDSSISESGRYQYRLRYVELDGSEILYEQLTVDVIVTDSPHRLHHFDGVEEFGVDQNYPNPFNGTTTFRLRLPSYGKYEISTYNLAGCLVYRSTGEGGGLVDAVIELGDQPSGVYIMTAKFGGKQLTRKAILIK